MIRGVGVDAVPVARMRRALERTPRLSERVFTPHELTTARSRGSPAQSLAARFAAKEACRKALGVPLRLRSVEVFADESRVPHLRVEGYADLTFHVSLTHTDDMAVAIVLAESSR